MNKSTRFSLIAFVVLVIAAAIVLLLNFQLIKSSPEEKECLQLQWNSSETCHTSNPNPFRYYGTKTSYHIAIKNNKYSDLPIAGCTAKVFYFLGRHATRYPDQEYIVELIDQLPVLKERVIQASNENKSKLCEPDIQKIKEWVLKMGIKDDNKLSKTGKKEAEDIAIRLKDRFSSILNQKYSPDKFVFEYTSRARTRDTAEGFAKGLFGERYKDVNFEDGENDVVLNFHKECKKMRKKCKDPNYDLSEIEKFENGPLMEKVVQSVSSRIGFNVTSDEVQLVQIACSFGYALNQSDAWCALFTEDELQVLEYAADIDDYYKDAYGNKVNYEQACPVAKYIVDLFEQDMRQNSSRAVLQFSHAGSIKKVFPLFGLFRDDRPLTADGFCEQRDRRWRSSVVSPFAANLALVLYECGGRGHRVAALHNERAVEMDGCGGEVLCPLDRFLERYRPVARGCDLDAICCTCCRG